jgi:hypothetical protein
VKPFLLLPVLVALVGGPFFLTEKSSTPIAPLASLGPPVPPGFPGFPMLTLTPTNAGNYCLVIVPDNLPIVSAAGGSESVIVTNYSGPAWMLSADGLVDNDALFIECSHDLQHWQPFPAPGFQLTLTASNNASVFCSREAYIFYRGRKGLVN